MCLAHGSSGSPANRPAFLPIQRFGSKRSAQLWLNLQSDYDIQLAERDLGKLLDRIVTLNKPRAAWTLNKAKAAYFSASNPLTGDRPDGGN